MLHVDGLETTAGRFRLHDVTLTAPQGSYGVLLGPPGSGKSVLIETVCGLRQPTAGRVLIDGHDVTHLEPRDRLVGYVPQDYVLFPTRKVVDNVVFGLRERGVKRANALNEARWVIDLLDIAALQECFTGSFDDELVAGSPSFDCLRRFDFNEDKDIDLDDFALWRQVYDTQ